MFRKKGPEFWKLKKCKWKGSVLHCEMDAQDFDKAIYERSMKGAVVPIINGVQTTYLSTPAYPIIIKRVEAKRK